MNMDILYITDARVPSEKAHVSQIIKMCDEFNRIGSPTELVVPKKWYQTQQMKQVKDVKKHYCVNSIKTIRLQVIDHDGPKRYYLFNITFMISAAMFLIYKNIIYRKKYVIYTRFLPVIFVASVLRPLFRYKIIFEAHIFPSDKEKKRTLWLLKKTDGLVVITNKLKELYSKENIKKILVAHDAVDTSRFIETKSQEESRKLLKLPEKSVILGFVGKFYTLDLEKGIGDLIDAYVIIKKKRKDVKLCLVGGPEKAILEYRQQIEKLGISKEDIILKDHIPFSDVPEYLNAMDILVIPTPWKTFFAYYVSPLKLFEYMISKKPIVATDLPSLKEILRDNENAVLVKHNNPESLAKGILKVLEDKPLAKKISKQAYNDVINNYTWNIRAKNIIDFIRKI